MNEMLHAILDTPRTILAGLPEQISIDTLAAGAMVLILGASVALMRARERRMALARDRRLEELERALAHRIDVEKTLRGLVLRQAERIETVESRHGKVRTYLLDLDARVSAQSSLGEAIDRVRRGASLEPLLRKRRLSTEEARLIRQIHHTPGTPSS